MNGEWNLLIASTLLLIWGFPLVKIAKAWRGTSLGPTLLWIQFSWFYWLCLPALLILYPKLLLPFAYLGLILPTCAFVSVLGARYPGLYAWNVLVVCGLAAVLLLPIAEQDLNSPDWRLDELRSLFVGLILLVGLLNYLPTRHWLATILFIGVQGCLLYDLHFGISPHDVRGELVGIYLGVSSAAWLATLRGHGPGPFTTPNRLWLAFRDRYGAFWALRVLEQTNHALKHANWQARLSWFGFEDFKGEGTAPREAELMERLKSLLRRFIPGEGIRSNAGT